MRKATNIKLTKKWIRQFLKKHDGLFRKLAEAERLERIQKEKKN